MEVKMIIVALVLFIVGIGTLAGSMYGLGKHRDDKLSDGYQAATNFAYVGTVCIIIAAVITFFSSRCPSVASSIIKT